MLGKQFFNYFSFTKSERNGLLLMALIDLLLIFCPDLFYYFIPGRPVDSPQLLSSFMTQQSAHEATDSIQTNDGKLFANRTSYKPLELFNFDPNRATHEQWLRLGLKEKTILTISKYIDHGGRFRKPEDLKKIWGISMQQANALMPYVKIENEENRNDNKKIVAFKSVFKKIIELNEADSMALDRLPGIGPTLAHRIISFRQKLGGFYEIGQLKEVWGLKDSIIDILKTRCSVDGSKVIKIDINQVNQETLKMHPYFGYKTTKALINYRLQHGDFKSLEDIQQIISIDEETYKKIIHYLVVNK